MSGLELQRQSMAVIGIAEAKRGVVRRRAAIALTALKSRTKQRRGRPECRYEMQWKGRPGLRFAKEMHGEPRLRSAKEMHGEPRHRWAIARRSNVCMDLLWQSGAVLSVNGNARQWLS